MAINLASKKILVVEDQPIMRETLKHILGSFGARFIAEAESGINAIAAMRIDRFDIVLCDYNLPKGKNGQQILEEARHLKLLPVNAIFIIVTCEQSQEMVLTALDNKPDDYLIKPFNRVQLLSRIERCYVRKKYLASVEDEIEAGNLYQAIRNCEKLLQQDDKKMRMQLLKMQAELTLKVGDYQKAEALYQDILQERELPWARLGLGIVAFHLDYYDQAAKTFQELIEQYPVMLEAYDWLVKTHEAAGNEELAVSSLNSAVTLSPNSILRQQKLAALADKIDNLPVAKKAYNASIKLGKNSIHRSSNDYAGLAGVHLKNKSAGEALRVLNELNQQFHNDPEAKLRAAMLESEIHRTRGNKALAQQAYDRTCQLSEQYNKQLSRELRLDMAKTFYQNDDKDACDEILTDLVKTNIDDKFFINAIVKMCNTLAGENYAETLIQHVKKELVDINNRGVSLFQEGNIQGALAVFEQAIEKMPENQTLILNIIKTIIHHIKNSGATPDKINKAQSYINKAIQIGALHDQISGLQAELDAIQLTFNANSQHD
ncbi:MAG: response regulator [Methylobacter sp.]